MENMTVTDIERLLRETATAHHVHETQSGEADANWQGWYARYIYDSLHPHATEVDASLEENEAGSSLDGLIHNRQPNTAAHAAYRV